ncbi:MAG: hypothetical protein QOI46_4745 [Alphaproteobacteria bacterium]|nr:hypothetical protein [Alphaproteobacteria bacterium]
MRAPARGFFATRMLAHPRGPYMTAGFDQLSHATSRPKSLNGSKAAWPSSM